MSARGEYRGIHTVLIDGPDYQALSPAARLVLLTLKLNLGGSGIDVFYPQALEAQTGHPASVIERAVVELERAGWVQRERNVWWVVNGLKYEPSRSLANDNHKTEIRKHANGLPRLPIVARFLAHYGMADTIPDGIPDTLPDPIPNQGKGEGRGKKGKGSPTAASAAEGEPAGFAAAWAAYPRREGSNPRRRALRAYCARLGEGVEEHALLAGVRRYAAFCAARGKVGTAFVQQAATFFGPDRPFAEAWAVAADPEFVQLRRDLGLPEAPKLEVVA